MQSVEVHFDMAGTVEARTFVGERVRYGILSDGRGWVQVDGRPKTAFRSVWLIDPDPPVSTSGATHSQDPGLPDHPDTPNEGETE